MLFTFILHDSYKKICLNNMNNIIVPVVRVDEAAQSTDKDWQHAAPMWGSAQSRAMTGMQSWTCTKPYQFL